MGLKKFADLWWVLREQVVTASARGQAGGKVECQGKVAVRGAYQAHLLHQGPHGVDWQHSVVVDEFVEVYTSKLKHHVESLDGGWQGSDLRDPHQRYDVWMVQAPQD